MSLTSTAAVEEGLSGLDLTDAFSSGWTECPCGCGKPAIILTVGKRRPGVKSLIIPESDLPAFVAHLESLMAKAKGAEQ